LAIFPVGYPGSKTGILQFRPNIVDRGLNYQFSGELPGPIEKNVEITVF